jgi:hypothetical protein
MARIRCHYIDCVFLDEGYCSAAQIELDPDTGRYQMMSGKMKKKRNGKNYRTKMKKKMRCGWTKKTMKSIKRDNK